MNWGSPSFLLLLFVVGALAVVVALGGWRHRTVLGRVFAPAVLERVLPRSTRIRRTIRDIAMLLGLALAVVSLAEPRFDKQIRTVTARGADVMLIVDLSRSMDARDVDPSRLQRARREVADLARMVQGDRVGLVVFSGGAYLRLPLTADLVALQNVLEASDTSTFQAQGSALGAAIDEAIAGLSRSEGQAGQAILVLSDGEIHDGAGALEAADRAADLGVAIYAMGIGIEAAPIPLPDGTLLTQGGKVVKSAPDFTVLQQVAERTGGAFVQSVASTRDIEGLYQGEIRRKLVTVERSSSQRETWRAAFQWPLGLGLLLWLGGAWLGDGRRRFGAAQAGLALLLLATTMPAASWASSVEEADRLYRSERFAEAAEELTGISLERPGDADVFDRLGAARYRSGDYDGASRAWEEASRLRGGDPDALFNAGNADYRSGRLEDALARYDEALQLAPEHAPSKSNQELVEKALKMRRQKPPPSGGGGSDDKDSQQDGQGSNQGEGGEGEQGDQENSGGKGQQPQDGQPQDGQPQDGTADDPQQGSESEGSPEQGAGQGSGEGEPTDQEPQGEGSDAVSPSELDGEGTDSEGEGPDGQPVSGGAIDESQGPITAGQAERLLDGIEEGTQRVYVRGRGEEKPW